MNSFQRQTQRLVVPPRADPCGSTIHGGVSGAAGQSSVCHPSGRYPICRGTMQSKASFMNKCGSLAAGGRQLALPLRSTRLLLTTVTTELHRAAKQSLWTQHALRLRRLKRRAGKQCTRMSGSLRIPPTNRS